MGKAKRAQRTAAMLGTLRFAQPTSRKGRITYGNKTFMEFSGYDERELLVTRDAIAASSAILADLLAEKGMSHDELVLAI